MSMPTGQDPIDRLHAADPIRADDLPDASLARVSARVQEHIVSDHRRTPILPPTRGPLALFGGLVIAGAIVLAIALGSALAQQTPVPAPAAPAATPAAPT